MAFENNVAYTKNLEDKLVDLIGEALAKMEPASLSYGVGRAHFALNRREPTAKGIKLGKNPAGPTDESVPILRVQNAGGKPLAIVFGYACHNTTLRPDMMKIAADFAGYAQDRIEADNPGAVAAVCHRLRGRRRPPSVRHPRDGQGTRRRAGRGRQVRPGSPDVADELDRFACARLSPRPRSASAVRPTAPRTRSF